MSGNLNAELDAALGRVVSPESAVCADIWTAIGDDDVRYVYVRPETVFDADSVYNRVVAFIVTDRRLLLVYSDTNYEMDPAGEYVTTSQSVRLDDIREYHVVRRRAIGDGAPRELNSILLRLRWGNSWSQDLQPGACDDPNCLNDHGYVGLMTNEDLQLFLDRTVDTEFFDQGVRFIENLAAELGRR